MISWRKSSHSSGGADVQCVELARLPQGVGIRDSKNPDGGHVAASPPAFRALILTVKSGKLG